MFLDLVRTPSSNRDPDFVKVKVKREILIDLDVLEKNQYDANFLDGFDPVKYKVLIKN